MGCSDGPYFLDMDMKDILDRIADSSANESSHELICRLRDCAHEIEALRSALACRPDAQADERYDLLQAAVNCPHEIESNRVVLHYSDKQPGHNALAQLRERLTRAAAPQAGAAQGAPTSEVIIDAFRRAGMNLDPTPNALYTVRGQHAQLIEGVRSLLAATPQPPQPAMSEERIATIQTLMLDWVDSKPGDEAKEVWNRIEEHLRTLAEPVAPAEQPRECGEPSEDAMAMSAALRMDEDGAIDERCPTRECGERQVAALSDEQARTVECADSWLRMRGLQTYTDLRDTLFAVLRAIGYTEEFAEANPDLKVSEGVKLFLAASAPTLGDDPCPFCPPGQVCSALLPKEE